MTASGWHRKVRTQADTQRQREYNSREHKQRRQDGQCLVDAGQAYCWRCGRWLPPGCQWHLGHADYDRTVYRGPECVSCNLKAAASKGARMVNAKRERMAPNRWAL